jgi:hypothetical protein
MRTFLKRSMLALAVITPAGLTTGGGVSNSQAEGGSHQYYLGTQGESCSGGCLSDRHICCTIVVNEY